MIIDTAFKELFCITLLFATSLFLGFNSTAKAQEDKNARKEWKRKTDVEWHMENAMKGDMLAQYMIGEALFIGDGIQLDIQEGVKWLTEASNQGHIPSTCSLGIKYKGPHPALVDRSKGQHQKITDYEKAFDLLKKGAKLGNDVCQRFLGHMYRNGEGIPIDNVLAHMWLSISYDQNILNSSYFAGEERDDLEGEMSIDEIEKARALAVAWRDSKLVK